VVIVNPEFTNPSSSALADACRRSTRGNTATGVPMMAIFTRFGPAGAAGLCSWELRPGDGVVQAVATSKAAKPEISHPLIRFIDSSP
jgi:hypothetical protein